MINPREMVKRPGHIEPNVRILSSQDIEHNFMDKISRTLRTGKRQKLYALEGGETFTEVLDEVGRVVGRVRPEVLFAAARTLLIGRGVAVRRFESKTEPSSDKRFLIETRTFQAPELVFEQISQLEEETGKAFHVEMWVGRRTTRAALPKRRVHPSGATGFSRLLSMERGFFTP